MKAKLIAIDKPNVIVTSEITKYKWLMGEMSMAQWYFWETNKKWNMASQNKFKINTALNELHTNETLCQHLIQVINTWLIGDDLPTPTLSVNFPSITPATRIWGTTSNWVHCLYQKGIISTK